WFAPLALLAAVISGIVIDNQSPYTAGFWLLNLTVTFGYTAAAFVLRRIARGNSQLRSLRDVVRFVFVALLASFCVAVAGSGLLVWQKNLRPAEFPMAALNWWIGDATSLVSFTPFLLLHVIPKLRNIAGLSRAADAVSFSGRRRTGLPLARRVSEKVIQLLSIPMTLWIVFGWNLARSFELYYLFFIPILWIAVR